MSDLHNRLARLEAKSAATVTPIVEFIMPDELDLTGEFAPSPNALAVFKHA